MSKATQIIDLNDSDDEIVEILNVPQNKRKNGTPNRKGSMIEDCEGPLYTQPIKTQKEFIDLSDSEDEIPLRKKIAVNAKNVPIVKIESTPKVQNPPTNKEFSLCKEEPLPSGKSSFPVKRAPERNPTRIVPNPGETTNQRASVKNEREVPDASEIGAANEDDCEIDIGSESEEDDSSEVILEADADDLDFIVPDDDEELDFMVPIDGDRARALAAKLILPQAVLKRDNESTEFERDLLVDEDAIKKRFGEDYDLIFEMDPLKATNIDYLRTRERYALKITEEQRKERDELEKAMESLDSSYSPKGDVGDHEIEEEEEEDESHEKLIILI